MVDYLKREFSLIPDFLWRYAFGLYRYNHAGVTARSGRKRRHRIPPTRPTARSPAPEATKRNRNNAPRPRRGLRSLRTTETTQVREARVALHPERTRQLSTNPTLQLLPTTLTITRHSSTLICTTKTPVS